MSSDPSRPSAYTPFLRRFTDEAARDLSETIALYQEVRGQHDGSPWSEPDVVERIRAHCAGIVGKLVTLPDNASLLQALDRCLEAVIAEETTIISFPTIGWGSARLSMRSR